jgi:CRISPR-associated protein Cas2
MTEELTTLLIYDIEPDRERNRIADICKDYGLERIQFSAFMGRLNRNMRQELFLKLGDVLGDKPGKIMLLAICSKDMENMLELINEKSEADEQNLADGE